MLDEKTTTFLTVCEKMNYTRAAEALHITQPAVSRHIRVLEEHYGAKLFMLEGKKIHMTPQGELLYEALMKINSDEIALMRRMDAFSSRRSVSFGVTLTVGEFMISRPLARYKLAHKDVSVKMRVANTSKLLEDLRKGRLDFAVLEGNFPENEFESIPLVKEPFIAAGAPGLVAPKINGSIRDLTKYTLIIREAGSGTRNILEKCLAAEKMEIGNFSDIMEIGNMNAIRDLASMGCGITFLYESAVKDMIEDGKLEKIEIPGFDVTHEISVIWRKNSLFRDDKIATIKEIFGQ